MGGADRATTLTPTNLTMMDHHGMANVVQDSPPVPARCASSISGSDLMGGSFASEPILTSYEASVSWLDHSSRSSEDQIMASSVPRVVSTLMPSSETVASLSSKASGGELSGLDNAEQQQQQQQGKQPAGGSSKPVVATRRRQGAKAKSGEGTGGDPAVQRRQKRLERNRESARLSRRRRKQYLEVLESRVTEYSHDMDKGRREHVAKSVMTIKEKRKQLVNDSSAGVNSNDVLNKLRVLQTTLSRTSSEMMVTTTFRSQQLKSFALPPSTKFIMWLTLQSDAYYRGGRAASERLSAARIGERILNSGTDMVTPVQSMWPLLCSEVGLSYEQEEKVRSFQRTTLQDHNTWVERHTSFASGKAMESAHDAMQAVTLRIGQRERSTLGLLTPEQQLKFLSWADRNRGRIAPVTQKIALTPYGEEKYQTSDVQHPAGNLYVLNHRLQSILKKIPRAAPLVTGAALKKLARRPPFESLGCIEKEEEELSRGRSFASSGSLKRSASEATMDNMNADEKPHLPPISPPDAQISAAPTVAKVFGHLRDIIPPPPTPSVTMPFTPPIPSPTPVSSMNYHQHQHQPPVATHPGAGISAGPAVATFSAYSGAPSHPGAGPADPTLGMHRRKPSFLPAHLALVQEEMWPDDGGAAEDFLMNLVDEDWAIGEGIDMELDMRTS